MAAYEAVVSLMKIIDDIETHPSPPISLDKQQLESLTEKLVFLQEFLESYNSPFACSNEADPLEMRIVDAAHAAEDVIESYIVDTIQLSGDEQVSCFHFYQNMHRVIEEMELIKKEVTVIMKDKEVASDGDGVGLRIDPIEKKNHVMVGFDDVLVELLDRLEGGRAGRQVIPIVGMGGIGKTTLAKGAFEHPLIKERFDICVWATISQDYNMVETLRQVLSKARGELSNASEDDLGEILYKYLAGRRYFVVMDDMWSIEVWDKMKFFFPENNNGSRIIVTTRMSNLASCLTDSNNLVKMRFLDEVSSWTLFSNTVFGAQSFPTKLESIGKKIVEKCNGLPLAIIVVGGLMAKSELTLGYWDHIEKNFSSIVNSENGDYCLRILKLSYNHLPVYLKPCFLYMGVFEEDRAIRASTIVKLWISEGFLKPVDNKSLTTIAKEYLKELVDRNLIMVVHNLGILGNSKYCKIHDLLRDLSLKEAREHRFFYDLKEHSPPRENSQQRFVIPRSTSKENILEAFESMSHVRSYVCVDNEISELRNSRLLRTLYAYDTTDGQRGCAYSPESVFHSVNSRYLAFRANWECVIPSINLLWNLHTLIINCSKDFFAPVEIWKMHNLRHVDFLQGKLHLPDPPSIDKDVTIMENLEMIKGVNNFNLSEDVVKRIRNIKKLDMKYDVKLLDRVNYVSYLQCLSELESLTLWVLSFDDGECLLKKMSFPRSLKKLTLFLPSNFELEDILQTIGSLPLLRQLSLYGGRFGTREWETVEGQFPRLKSLTLYGCRDLENWTRIERDPFRSWRNSNAQID
ncbi:putative late blight resistance protein homolog R1C-3 [Salvia hispanica]|uniref:putative late blight resistance protein homolog R1C-3 n=1 Tax=Salvia hispanica TaxID=49212 RepID=UPI002008F8E0|nr:putative late blight resistance protein homolog R1C-3 [Salvia hispanica]